MIEIGKDTMELRKIEEKLNTLLTGTERKIVFWYDDDASYEADIFYYSEHFYSDKMAQLCRDLGIPEECQDAMKKYAKF